MGLEHALVSADAHLSFGFRRRCIVSLTPAAKARARRPRTQPAQRLAICGGRLRPSTGTKIRRRSILFGRISAAAIAGFVTRRALRWKARTRKRGLRALWKNE